jgi:hypothetical protein
MGIGVFTEFIRVYWVLSCNIYPVFAGIPNGAEIKGFSGGDRNRKIGGWNKVLLYF